MQFVIVVTDCETRANFSNTLNSLNGVNCFEYTAEDQNKLDDHAKYFKQSDHGIITTTSDFNSLESLQYFTKKMPLLFVNRNPVDSYLSEMHSHLQAGKEKDIEKIYFDITDYILFEQKYNSCKKRCKYLELNSKIDMITIYYFQIRNGTALDKIGAHLGLNEYEPIGSFVENWVELPEYSNLVDNIHEFNDFIAARL